MTEFQIDETEEPEPVLDHEPVNVRIVEDSTASANPGNERPRHIDTRRYTVVAGTGVGIIPVVIATKNLHRHQMIITADPANAQNIYLMDTPIANSTQLDNTFGLPKGVTIVLQSTHELYMYGANPGDMLYILEESYDA